LFAKKTGIYGIAMWKHGGIGMIPVLAGPPAR
jgi:hypothetical protein